MLLFQILTYTTHGKIKKNYKNSNKFNISAPIWNKDFELPDGSYFLSNIQIFLSISSKSMNK